jgi:phospholipase C
MTPLWQRLEQRQTERFYDGSDDKFAAVRPRPDLPPGTDLEPRIKHIVVLMMENHSYDNYFGCLGRGDGFCLDADGKPSAANPTAAGQSVSAHHFQDTGQHPDVPTQSWFASHVQYWNGANDGFVRSAQLTVPGADVSLPMGFWTAADLPFYYSLGSTFPVADRWFGSCLGPTFPNRRFLIAGTAHGLIDDSPLSVVDYPTAGTIFDLLSRNNISWANYHAVPRLEVLRNGLLGKAGAAFLRRLAFAVGRLFPEILKRAEGRLRFTANIYPLGLARAYGHSKSLRQFFKDADQGTLPSFCLVDPDFGAFSEENPQDAALGEGFAAEVIRHVMHGPGWPNTILFWVYDENGGYFDHVPPGDAVEPDDVVGRSIIDVPKWVRVLCGPLFARYVKGFALADQGHRAYDRYGFRVPAVIVSPFAKRDYVDSTVYDHTSILKLLQEKWNLPALTRRDAAATAPWNSLDLNETPFLEPPVLSAPAKSWRLDQY